MKTFLKNVTILSVYNFQVNEKKLLGKIIYGVVVTDESLRFESGFGIITSTIKSQNNLEFITKSGSRYVIDAEPDYFDISFVEFVVMRHQLSSPSEILEMRQALKLNDDRILH